MNGLTFHRVLTQNVPNPTNERGCKVTVKL